MEQSRNDQDAHYSYDGQRYCTAIRSIDTVRALHQTVVSLRSALDESRQEIEKLKKQIVVNNEIQEARHLHHISENPSAADNRSLGEKVSELEKFYKENKTHEHQTTEESRTSATHSKVTKIESTFKNEQGQTISVVPDIKISTHPSTSGTSSTINNMASRIDVKIKVSSNINVNDSSTEDSDSQKPTSETQDDSNQEDNKSETTDGDADEKNKVKNPEIEVYEDSNTNTFNVDAKNLKIKVTSEENLNVTKSVERICIQQSSSEYLNLDIDELSEGDNSVFTEGATTPIMERMQQVEDIETDGEGGEIQYDEGDQKEEQEKDDIPDEVDDIELIFSSDDNKDVMQEDLVSISEYEPWQTPGASGTPILTKFGSLSSEDRHREHYEEKKLAYKQAKLKQAKQQQQKEKNLSVDSQATIGIDKSLESTDSLSFDNNNNKNSLDYKSSSLEKDSSIDQNTLSRDTSLDIPKPTSLGLNRKWTNVNVLIETDISKIGIGDNENILEMGRRNTCPNPPVYRPIIHSQTRTARNPLAVKFNRPPRGFCPIFSSKSPKFTPTLDEIPATKSTEEASKVDGNKCSSSVQTDISALPHQWRSETQLVGHEYSGRLFTLPSKYSTPHHPFSIRSGRNALRLSDKTQEARRILLSDINFTSMVPELSRSADHLCQQRIREEDNNDEDEMNESANYFKGNLLKTPDYSNKGITPSFSMTSPGVSQWTVNESTTQTDGYWNRGDSFDSTKSYSLQSGTSMNLLSKHHRSRSVPSMKCCICKQNHAHNSIRPSESLQYAQKHNNVTLRERSSARKVQGSLPDLRHQCSCSGHVCSGKNLIHCFHGCSSGSTESLLEETDEFLRKSVDDSNTNDNNSIGKRYNRRCSENDIQRDYRPSKQALPFLPRSPKCLKPGHLAKVIAKNGRVVVGRIRYVGPVASINANDDEIFIGLQLQNSCGDCDGTVNGKKFFECEQNFGLFVPFKKVVMAWNS